VKIDSEVERCNPALALARPHVILYTRKVSTLPTVIHSEYSISFSLYLRGVAVINCSYHSGSITKSKKFNRSSAYQGGGIYWRPLMGIAQIGGAIVNSALNASEPRR
jgi:hypothetical protein